MSLRSLKLLVVDDDPIFLTGLRTICEQFPDLQVVAEARSGAEACQILKQAFAPSPPPSLVGGVDVLILNLGLAGLSLCQQLDRDFPSVPVLLLTSVTDADAIAAAVRAGVEGCCPKGTPTTELITAIRRLGAGETYFSSANLPFEKAPFLPLTKWRRNTGLYGLGQINRSLQEVQDQLQQPGLSALDRAFFQGRRRELMAAHWLLGRFLLGDSLPDKSRENPSVSFISPISSLVKYKPLAKEDSNIIKEIQSPLFDFFLTKLDSPLANLSGVALEIDILRPQKKRELLVIVLRQLEEILQELRFSQVESSQIKDKRLVILQDLWRAVTIEFFGKYYTVLVTENQIEVVPVLLQDGEIVTAEILDKIPLVAEFFSHLLFQTSVMIDNVAYAYGTSEATLRMEAILQNLILQVANAVVQPLLNHFADVEEIKQAFYDRRLLSSRSIIKFRNNLSWKYRVEKYIGEPRAIFESCYWLFVLDFRGVNRIPIYAPRGVELAQLSGIPLAVTYVLESRDAVAPRLRSAVAFLGNGVVYLLTQVIGRAIGLIARGIIQGIGNALPDNTLGKNSQRRK